MHQNITISDQLRVFLVNLDVALSRVRTHSLTPAQAAAQKKQNQLLVITIESMLLGKDYRKHILSAMLGRTIASQNELSWYEKSDILDALELKEENGQRSLSDYGRNILKEITGHLISNPTREPRSLFEGARVPLAPPRNLPHMWMGD